MLRRLSRKMAHRKVSEMRYGTRQGHVWITPTMKPSERPRPQPPKADR